MQIEACTITISNDHLPLASWRLVDAKVDSSIIDAFRSTAMVYTLVGDVAANFEVVRPGAQ
jgi:hypothetical protein